MSDQGIPAQTVQNEVGEKSVENEPKPQKKRKVLDGATNLYHYFNANQELIYVGVSLSAMGRMLQHRDTSPWFDEIAWVRIDKFKTRKAALEAERYTIKNAKPKYNIVHGPDVVRIQRKLIRIYGSMDEWRRKVLEPRRTDA